MYRYIAIYCTMGASNITQNQKHGVIRVIPL
jgi:hypothetical protein